MLRETDRYYMKQEEPVKGCLLFLRQHILSLDTNLTEAWKYSMPFFCYKGKMCCYLWVHKKYKQPYIGIVEGAKMKHPELLQEARARMKILLIDAEKDIPVKKITAILKDMLQLYK